MRASEPSHNLLGKGVAQQEFKARAARRALNEIRTAKKGDAGGPAVLALKYSTPKVRDYVAFPCANDFGI